jgi:hypothetical protein
LRTCHTLFTSCLRLHIRYQNCITILSCSTTEAIPRRKVLILINPFSGRKRAVKIFREQVEPMLKVSHVQPHVILSERPLHVTEIAQSLNLDEYDALCTISGDGLLHELINGAPVCPLHPFVCLFVHSFALTMMFVHSYIFLLYFCSNLRCMYACMYVRVCITACMYIYIYVCMNVRVCACMSCQG